VYLTRDDKIQIQGDLSCLEEIYKERGARNFLQRMVYTPEYLKKRGGPNEKCQSFVDDYIRKMKSGLKSGKSLRYSYQCSQKIQKDFLNLYGTTYQQILPLLLLSSQEL